ncbi:MAG: PEP-CTERM sorting domain-containing protein [Phycisphaeraceae bacterium]
MKRTHRIVSSVACAAAVFTAGDGLGQIVSTFDSDLDGWTAVGFNFDTSIGAILSRNVISKVQNTGDMVHSAFNGNPGGFALFTDAIVDPGSFAEAPDKFTGDLTGLIGQTVSFDHRLFDQGTNPTSVGPYTLVFLSGDPNDLNAYGIVVDGPTLGQGDTGWVTISATIADGGPNGLQPFSTLDLGVFDPDLAGTTTGGLGLTGSMTFEQVMSNVTDFYVSFELVDNNSNQSSEVGGIDNVTITPEPASLALLGLGGLLFARRRR